jgi:hypothetical protein
VTAPANRDEQGRFPKGVSGNPTGRPKNDGWFRELCRKRTVKALKALTSALSDPDSRVAAAKALLEFGWGKAPARLELGASDGGLLQALGVTPDVAKGLVDEISKVSPDEQTEVARGVH